MVNCDCKTFIIITWSTFKNVDVYRLVCTVIIHFANGFVLLILERYRAFGGNAPLSTCTSELIEASELLILLHDAYNYTYVVIISMYGNYTYIC